MSLYRDERDALRARLEELERDLEDARADLDREALRKQLAALSAQVAEATARVEGDRAALGEVAASIQKLQASLGGAAAGEAPKVVGEAAQASADASSSAEAKWIVIAAAAVILVGGAAIVMGRKPPPEDANAATAGIPGAPHAVDPTALLPTARGAARARGFLVSIEARYVGSNGRVDLDAPTYRGSITYTFGERPPEVAPNPSAPLGAPKPSGGMPMVSEVRLDATGMHVEPFTLGYAGAEVPEPKCSLEDVWKAARAAGAPESAVAVVTYKQDKLGALGTKSASTDSGAAWLFRIEGTDISLRIEDPSCQATSKPSFFQ